LVLALALVSAGVVLAVSDPEDAEGTRDPALFTRMPGFHIYRAEASEFDRVEFMVGPDRTQAIEGRRTLVIYYANEGITLPSGLQVVRNYLNAAQAIGGKQVYAYEDGGTEIATLKVVRDKAEVWVEVRAAGNGMYNVHLVEKQLMTQAVVANADSLAGSIETDGKVAVYGIYFDTDKSEIKPESEPALVEIARLLQRKPGLKVYVVGHTDNAGAFEHNLKLSRDRAAAVVAALTGKHGIAASRLQPFGAGPTSPAASNQTEDGRARNRRVELVAQ
jgi:outer membrane protein OmpA-like peptidoglycan-associated protein